MAALLVTGVAFDLILIPFCGAVGAAIFAYLAFFAGGAGNHRTPGEHSLRLSRASSAATRRAVDQGPRPTNGNRHEIGSSIPKEPANSGMRG